MDEQGGRDDVEPHVDRMIDKSFVKSLVDQWLEDKEYFLTDLTISPDDRIVVEIDHERDREDFELEVGSAGIGQPFKVLRQYEIHQGERVEVLTTAGKKLQGVLSNVTPEGFTLTIEEKVREEGQKRPKLVSRDLALTFEEVKWTKYLIDFK